MGNESHSNGETPCSWCIQAHNQNQWLHSALSEMERSTKGMQAIVNQDDGPETYHHRRPELLEMVEEFRRSYHTLAEYCTHFSIRSTQSGSSLSHPGSSFKSITNKTSSSSTPDSSIEFPEVDSARVAIPEELSREVERTVGELARRNEEKREAKRELQARVQRLVEENEVLQRRLGETAQENAALLNSPSSVVAAKRSRLSRLRIVICGSCASAV